MHRCAHRPILRASLLTAVVLVAPALSACSSDDTSAPPETSSAPGTTGSATGTTMITDEARLAEAKTVAVGFFEAQAVNDYDRARERSGGAASLAIDWAEGVNSIDAAESSGYQVPSVTAPNVRVQIDALVPAGDDLWVADGFVELSFRPGPVASTTTTTAAGTDTTEVASPSTYVVDLAFAGDGDAMRLVDYRLDDLPYPVSQLFLALDTPTEQVDGIDGTAALGHRDLDGSVQYLVRLEASEATAAGTWTSRFTPAPDGAPVSSTVPEGADTTTGETFVDPLVADETAWALAVFPGAFPGSAGTLALTPGVDPTSTTTTTAAPPGSVPATTMSWALPAFAELTPRPVNTVVPSTSTTTSSTSTTSTTTAPADASSTTAPTSVAPSSTAAPTSTTTTSRPSTTTSTTTAP